MESSNPLWARIRGCLLLYRSLLCKLEPGFPTLKLSRLLSCLISVHAGKWLPWPDLHRPRLPLVLSALLLWSDSMLLCGVTNACSKGPGVYLTVCACVFVCVYTRMLYAANQHAGAWLAYMKMSRFHGLQRPRIPLHTHIHTPQSMQIVVLIIVHRGNCAPLNLG